MLKWDRRTMLAGGFATAVALGSSAVAAPRRKFFDRVGLPVGLQTYALGDEAGRDLDATFSAVAEIGYRDLELPSLYGRSARDVRAAADRAGLRISSLHLPMMRFGSGSGLSMLSPTAEIAENLGALGAYQGVAPIGIFPDDFRPQPGENGQAALGRAFTAAGADIWKRTAAMLNERAVALKPQGISIGYHNHNIEFAPIGGTTGWDILLEECDPAVHFEIDTGWVATAGLDPAAFLRKHKGRVAQLHVKDVAASNTPNFVLSMQPAEVGAGKLDWARILPAAHEAGVRHFYVEQEPPFAIPRIEAARRSYAFLSRLRA